MEETKWSWMEGLVLDVHRIFLPLLQISSPESAIALMKKLGYELPVGTGVMADFTSIAEKIEDLLDKVQEVTDAPSSVDMTIQFLALVKNIKEVVVAILGIKENLKKISCSSQELLTQASEQIPLRLLDYLFVSYLRIYHLKAHAILLLLGIIKSEEQDVISLLPAPQTIRESYEYLMIKWNRLPTVLVDPVSILKGEYKWQVDDEFDSDLFMMRIQDVMRAFCMPGGLYTQAKILHDYFKRADADIEEIRIPLWQAGVWPETYAIFGLNVFPLPRDGNKPKGLALVMYVHGAGELEFDVSDVFKLILTCTAGIDNGIGIMFRPVKEVEFLSNALTANRESMNLELKADVVEQEGRQKEIVILGSEKSGMKLSLNKPRFQLFASGNNASRDFGAILELDELKLVVSSNDGDGFLQKVLPQDPVIVSAKKLALGISSDRGFYIAGGAEMAYVCHINEQFGPIYISTINFGLNINDSGMSLLTGITGSAQLGPVTASIEDMGLRAELIFGKPGLLGNADLDFAFKPPDGIGLAVDAETVKGSGYLAVEDGNYYGVVALEIQDRISVNAIGILITRMESGEKTFSFKILGFAEFEPVQIGFGFSISGVGLVVAIDCRMDEEKLRAAVYGGTLRSLLFPTDIIANATQIIRDLNDFFPPQADTYVIGAMLKIGWGCGEPIVKADVGIFCEFGSNLRIILAGIAYACLPNEQSPILVLRVQVLGVLDFGRKTLAIDASLTGSKLLNWALDGNLALRTAWGDAPRFALSAGGFYPGYKPPPGFPSLRRISLSIGTGNPRIGLCGYFAVTENSVQVGAALLFYWHKKFFWPVGHIEIEGTLGFDALFQFNPFYFKTNFSATFDLKRNGDSFLAVRLHLELSGPNNYHAVGDACFEICGFDLSVHIDEWFGTKRPEIRQVRSGKDILIRELQNDKNWRALEPVGTPRGTILRQDRAVEKLYEPLGTLCFLQRSLPLRYRLYRIGHALPVQGENWFDIVPAQGQSEDRTESFAPGDFRQMANNERISAPAFEKMKAGIVFEQNQTVECALDTMTSRPAKYETTIIRDNPNGGPANRQSLGRMPIHRTGAMERMESAIGRRRHTHAPLLMKAISRDKSYKVGEQQVTVVTETFQNGFERAKTGGGSEYPQASYAEVRQAFEDAGGAGTGMHIVDAAQAAKR